MDSWLITYLALVLVSLVTVIVLALDIRSMRKKQRVKRYITVEKCYKCNYMRTRKFEEGDYVGAKGKFTCPQCGEQMTIDAVYVKVEDSIKKLLLIRRVREPASQREGKEQQIHEK